MSYDDFSVRPISKARAKIIADLDRTSARRDHGLFRIEGWRALESAVAAGVKLEEIVIRDDALTGNRLQLLRNADAQTVWSVGSRGMTRLTSVVQDQGVVATAPIRLASSSDLSQCSRILALDGVQDPGNVGTLIRTAAWFGIDAVLADDNTADFFNPKVVRSTAGGIWDVALVRSDDFPSTLRQLKEKGFACYGADIDRTVDSGLGDAVKSILVLGSEGHGLSEVVRSLLDGFVMVRGRRRGSSGVESLNVATAGSILIARWVDTDVS